MVFVCPQHTLRARASQRKRAATPQFVCECLTSLPLYAIIRSMSLALSFDLLSLFLVSLLIFVVGKFLLGNLFHRTKCYTVAEMESFQESAEKAFGDSPAIFHEKESSDIHLDFLLFPPNEHCPFFTLCTMGLGAHRMNVPVHEMQEEAKEHPELNTLMFPGWDRTELLMYLPADWAPAWMKEGASEEEIRRSFWPIQTMTVAARYMVSARIWYAFSHTYSDGAPLFPGSDFVAIVFASPLPDCRTPGFTLKAGDKNVSVLQLIPLTASEYQAIKTDNAYEWLRNALPADAESMVNFRRERMKGI